MIGSLLRIGMAALSSCDTLFSSPAMANDWPSRSSTSVSARRVSSAGIRKPASVMPLCVDWPKVASDPVSEPYSPMRMASPPALGASVPAAGATLTRCKPVYGVDAKPVPLFYGTLPFYRDLAEGVEDGQDVKQLEENLKACGFGGFGTPDGLFHTTLNAATPNVLEGTTSWKDGIMDWATTKVEWSIRRPQ